MMEYGYHIVERQAKRGCPEGSILGPNFWNLVMNGLLRQLEEPPNTQPIAYADDLVILIPGNSRRALEERRAAAIEILEKLCIQQQVDCLRKEDSGNAAEGSAAPPLRAAI